MKNRQPDPRRAHPRGYARRARTRGKPWPYAGNLDDRQRGLPVTAYGENVTAADMFFGRSVGWRLFPYLRLRVR